MTKPKLLLLRPLAGHTAKIMDKTIDVLSQDFDVVMPDLRRDTYAEYLSDLQDFVLKYDNIIGVCQGGAGLVQALAPFGKGMIKDKRIALLGSPIDTDVTQSTASRFIKFMGIENLINRYTYRVWGVRSKIQGMYLVPDYMMLQPVAHFNKFVDYLFTFNPKTKDFYEMYFDTEDMSVDFFKESLKRTFFSNPRRVDIDNTNSILVVEGLKDDITAPGQTRAIFEYTPHVTNKILLEVDAGHYGVFSGSKFKKEVYPKLKEFFK